MPPLADVFTRKFPMRLRLTLWYAAVFTLVLGLAAVGAYSFLTRELSANFDESLIETAQSYRDALARSARQQPARAADEVAAEVVDNFRFGDRLLFLYEAERGRVAASKPSLDSSGESVQPLVALLESNPSSDGLFSTIEDGSGGKTRALTQPLRLQDRSFVLIVTRSLDQQERYFGQALRSLLVGLPLIVLIGCTTGYLLAIRTLSPISHLALQASAIGAENLDDRVEAPENGDELARLASVLNHLLERLEGSFRQQKAFMADASHELRTPVSIIRGEAEVVLSREHRSEAEYRASLAIISDESKRLSRIVENLFLIARADSGSYPLASTEFSLEETLIDSLRNARALVKGQRFETDIDASREYPMRGDEGLIRQLVMNLVDNALKFTPTGKLVRISLKDHGSDYSIRVTDEGSGVPSEARAKIFERFFRVDRKRNDASVAGGAGLGLPISRWIAQAHGGSLELISSDENGSIFEARLPRGGGLAASNQVYRIVTSFAGDVPGAASTESHPYN